MFHQRTSKTGRVVAKDAANLGLHYSFQAQATTVSERPTPRQGSSDRKIPHHDSDFLMMPSVSNPVIAPSPRFRISANGDTDNRMAINIQTVHSAPDSSELARQQQNSQTFHELNKVQRQILHPVPACVTDSLSLASSLKQNKEPLVKQQGRATNGAPRTHDRQFNDVHLPGDRVIFTESSIAPGVPAVYRLPEDRHANPDRLNLDRRKLTVCPILEGEDNVRLLNFQHNMITKIENLSQLKRLIFLDFYDNQLECISGLSSLKSLRVLMLGKNRIRKIEKLDALTKLDVLDLHGNKISHIDNLNHLSELRVLNLAGNDIVRVHNLDGMRALAELNLRRNKISTVTGIHHLPNLQRLFLSFNSIQSFDDINCLSQCGALSELSLDGNPLALEASYKQIILKSIPGLRQFDMKRISEEEKRVANIIARKEDEKRKEHGRITLLKEKKRLAINNAQRQWEKFHVSTPENDQTLESDMDVKCEPLLPERSENLFRPSETSDLSVCHLAELEGDTLFLYGPGSLDALDRNWGQQAANTVTTISFKFIDFDDIVPHLARLQIKFPVVQKIVFTSTNIHKFQQINALAAVKHLESLTIKDDNSVTSFALWKPYTLFRLAHLSLRQLNEVEITDEDIVKAEKFFGSLSHVTTSNLPQSRLLSLLGDSRKRHSVDSDKIRRAEGKHDRSLSIEGLGRAGLLYQSPEMIRNRKEESKSRTKFSGNYVKDLLQTCVRNHQQTKMLETLYPKVLAEMVMDYVRDMAHLEKFVEKSLDKA